MAWLAVWLGLAAFVLALWANAKAYRTREMVRGLERVVIAMGAMVEEGIEERAEGRGGSMGRDVFSRN